MGIALSDVIKSLLDRRNFAHLATILRDGAPHSAPVWVGREGDRLIVCAGEDSVKAKNTLCSRNVRSSSLSKIESSALMGTWRKHKRDCGCQQKSGTG
jgi:hypothetical protein